VSAAGCDGVELRFTWGVRVAADRSVY
jgi:hypothetical protein